MPAVSTARAAPMAVYTASTEATEEAQGTTASAVPRLSKSFC